VLTEEQEVRGAETARTGQGNESGTRRRRPPTLEDLELTYDAAERVGGLASALAVVIRIASGPLPPVVLAALPPLGDALAVARDEEARLYGLAHRLEAALA
jgi:hypothetical protein